MSSLQPTTVINEYMTFIDHPSVTIEMAHEYALVLEEEYQASEDDFLANALPLVMKGNDKALIPINSSYQLECRLREIISISDEFTSFYREDLTKALFKQAMSGLSERLQYARNGFTVFTNPEFQMATHYLSVVNEDYLRRILNMDRNTFFDPENRVEVIEKIRLVLAGVIWTQTNVGKHHHYAAANDADRIAREAINKRIGLKDLKRSNLCSEIQLPSQESEHARG
ncbi:hypothetical protein OTK49_03135 [Vibrio coralliirubri]|uniref:hypothetical protein n=1 Tax=Vibrio coralliirubri TaxID=1516159 RepID=UPI0022851ED2|nr:hypothetical protein [Vibrio coralliirubri]MCY9861510.1 hypothetical protein [Vibrio coralliirubri]